jgi:hypothetical protein
VRITFDSNAWETIFSPEAGCTSIVAALSAQRIRGFICAASFRIEAIRKSERATYFERPHMDFDHGIEVVQGRPMLRLSFGPNNARHPGLPAKQREKLDRAFAAGVLLIHGGNWMGLPCPREIIDSFAFVKENELERAAREQREIDASWQIQQRGVGKSAFDAEDGWEIRARDKAGRRRLSRACAEWADGETVSAHIAYQHDILCTNDRGRNAGQSVFDKENRAWLTETFGVRFVTVEEFAATIG